MEYPTTPVHRCLSVSEILRLIFEFIWLWDGDSCIGDADEDGVDLDVDVRRSNDGKKTLALLARTCRSFSVVALDVLWRVLNSLDPLLPICPKPEASSMDEADWSSFRKYAERVRSIRIRGHEARVPALVQQTCTASLERYPSDRLLILPNLTEFDWRETTLPGPDDSGIPLFQYFAGPAVTTIALSFVRFLVPPASELATLSELPNLCPNVTSAFLSCTWFHDPFRQVGEIASQWKRLRSLRSCTISKSDMDKLASQGTLQRLGIQIATSSPVYVGRIPDTVQELSFSSSAAAFCTHYLKNVHASPTICRLAIGMGTVNEAENEALFRLLPHCLDTSRLEHLTIQPRTIFPKTRSLELPKFGIPLIQAVTKFSLLRELDMDLFCTSQLDDSEYAWMATSLSYLRHLKVGTAKFSSAIRPRPVATVVAVITMLTHCPHLETLRIPFDGTTSPPSSLTQSASNPGEVGQERLGVHEPGGSSTVTCLGGLVAGRGVPNKRITKLHVGHSPASITDATIGVLASCLKSLMPSLKQIKHDGLDERWDAVQNVLTSQ